LFHNRITIDCAMISSPQLWNRIRQAVDRNRLLKTAVALVEVPSRTGEAGVVSDRLAELLVKDGLQVERPIAGHAGAPAVVARYDSGKPGRTLQFDGHLDTVHLPFVPPAVADGRLTGSGSADMKAGIAAAIEALRVLRDTKTLDAGTILLTAHDLHETPWGDGSQLDRLIAEGYVGDAVLLPEYLNDRLAVVGRGGLVWNASIRRSGPPIHEVMRPAEPSVISAGAKLVTALIGLNDRLATKSDPLAGGESVFVGQVHSGEIFNQYPQECRLEGTRRWLPGTRRADVEAELKALFDDVAQATGTDVSAEFMIMRDAFRLNLDDPFVACFQQAYAVTTEKPLPIGAKPFCDDGNSFWSLAGIPAITHGPTASGAHTLNEWVSIDDLVRIAGIYALTAAMYCDTNLEGVS
jgi:acetylornithine deacetylase/succinyl-diaminopimelate desuccinylase-like protein